jgi:hypothetical protein
MIQENELIDVLEPEWFDRWTKRAERLRGERTTSAVA